MTVITSRRGTAIRRRGSAARTRREHSSKLLIRTENTPSTKPIASAPAIGFVLGVFSVRISNFEECSRLVRAALPLLLMAVPLLDVITVMVTRAASGKPISRRGLDHTHDRLARLGLSELGVVVLL